MGIFTEARDGLRLGGTETKDHVAASTVPTGQVGMPQNPTAPPSYEQISLEAYGGNAVAHACIEELANTSSEPIPVAIGHDEKRMDGHAVEGLLEAPNKFQAGTAMRAQWCMYDGIAGNWFTQIVPGRDREPVELWNMRPDRVRVIPSKTDHIAGYVYKIGTDQFFIPPGEMIHYRANSPLNDYYGDPPLRSAFGNIDLDAFMLGFAKSFFVNAGVPAGLLTFKENLPPAEKAEIKRRFRTEYNGPGGFHSLMVTGGMEATYQKLGADPDDLAMPTLDEINEARIAMALQVPQSIIGTRLGNQSAAYANRKADREHFWRETVVPKYKRMAAELTLALKPFYPDLLRIEFDTTEVQALQEDQDNLHKRTREDYNAGIVGLQEAREAVGYGADIPVEDTFKLTVSSTLMPGSDVANPEEVNTAASGTQTPEGETADEFDDDAGDVKGTDVEA